MGREHEWVQNALEVKVAMICRMGLDANIEKTKAIACTPRLIKGKWGETAYKRNVIE